MRSTALALLFCIGLGLAAAGCDDKPKPGGPMPKASADVTLPAVPAR